jgi:hypothetical protein
MMMLVLDEEDLAKLRKLAQETVEKMTQELETPVGGRRPGRSVRHLVLNGGEFHVYRCPDSKYGNLWAAIELSLDRKNGLRMFCHNELAKPGTAVWEAVQQATGARKYGDAK